MLSKLIRYEWKAGRVNIRYPSSPSRFLEKRWIWMIRVSTKAAIKRPKHRVLIAIVMIS